MFRKKFGAIASGCLGGIIGILMASALAYGGVM
jgi:hypothetical protein